MTADNQWFHDILNRGLQTFVDHWGYSKIIKQWKTKGSISFSQADVRDRVETLQESQLLDPSGLTTYMTLRAYLHELLEETTYTAKDLLLNWEARKEEFAKLAQMRAELEHPDALELLKEYEDKTLTMCEHYGAKKIKQCESVIRDVIGFGFLQQSAFRSVEKKLKAHQFMQGKGATGDIKVHGNVFEFWNVNSLINASANQLFDGVALCLIRNPHLELGSFFCIAVKAGETLTVLTDRDRGAHPLHEQMRRRPDRDLERRADENWFPYQLLDLEFSADGKHMWAKKRDELVPINETFVSIAKLGDLHPPQLIWMGLTLERIAKQYASEKPKLLKSISYTAEMIRRPDALVTAEKALTLSRKYKPLELPRITVDDLDVSKNKADFRRKAVGKNRHIIERFKDQVPEDILNVVGDQELKLLREKDAPLAELKKKDWDSDPDTNKISLHTFSPLDFGTAKELDKDRHWTARYNQINYIKHLHEKEFNLHKGKMIEWYNARVQKNVDALIEHVATLDCTLPGSLVREAFGNHETKKPRNIVKYRLGHKLALWQFTDRKRNGNIYFGGSNDRRNIYTCFSDHETIAKLAVIFEPQTAHQLAYLAGTTVEELPEQLRHWTQADPYVGNSILDRIDPEDWVIDDLFAEHLKFRVCFAVSKSHFNKMRADRELPKRDFKGEPDHDYHY